MLEALRTLMQRWFGTSQVSTNAIDYGNSASLPIAPPPPVHDNENAHAHLVPYDENLLERARTQWQFGDWASLANIARETLQHHPDRAKLALLVATANLQENRDDLARQFIRLAQDWGCNKKLIAQILISGVHNSLGRAAAVGNQATRAMQHFENAITLVSPGGEVRLLAKARGSEQLAQLGINGARFNVTTENAQPATQMSLRKSMAAQSEELEKYNAQIENRQIAITKELHSVRQLLDSTIKKEVSNATKQLEAFLGVQNYFNTGSLPELSTEAHSWPISADFAVYLLELLEFNNYDLVIEFGSGVSTLLIAKTLAKISKGRPTGATVKQIAFEHLEKFHTQTMASLQHANLADAVNLVLAPLQSWQAPNGNTYQYYACESALAEFAQHVPTAGLRVLVLVDGPPASTGKHARYPAAPMVLRYFNDAHIDLLLDDYIRDDEKEIAKLWESDFNAAGKQHSINLRKLEKDACLFSLPSPHPAVSKTLPTAESGRLARGLGPLQNRKIVIMVWFRSRFGGGLQENIKDSALAILAAGGTPVVFCPPSALAQELAVIGVRVRISEFDEPNLAETVIREEGKIDLLHCHPGPCKTLALEIAKTTNTPVVMTIHGRWHDHLPEYISSIKSVITVSPFIADEIRGFAPEARARLVVIPNGVDTNIFHPVRPPTLANPISSLNVNSFVLYCARLDEDKVVAIQFMQQIWQKQAVGEFPAFQWRIAGDGPLKAEVMAKAHEIFGEDQQCVHFLGWQNRPQLAALMQQARATLVSGRACLEALACGCPAIAVGYQGYSLINDWENFMDAAYCNFGGHGSQTSSKNEEDASKFLQTFFNNTDWPAQCEQQTLQFAPILQAIKTNFDREIVGSHLIDLYSGIIATA